MSQSNQPQTPQWPQGQGQGAGSAYPAYPAYPGYPYNGYYPWYPTPAPVVLPPTPAERPARAGRARLANVVLIVVASAVTVAALALAAAAPALVSVAPAPGSLGLSQVYNGQLSDDTSHWDVGAGCVFEQGGLHATLQNNGALSLCAFLPSANSDLTSTGFYLTTAVGPAGAVSGQQEPCIVLNGDSGAYSLAFNQAGGYNLASGQTCSLQSATGALPEAVAWHTDGYTPNVISMQYTVESNQMVVYVNGQEITSIPAPSMGVQRISLGASGGGEAVFTSFALYSGS